MSPTLALPGSAFWTRTAYTIVIACILGFLALTTLGMLIYPGGTAMDKSAAGYRFLENYFSDLGLTQARNGSPAPAWPLFTLAMALAGGGLALFFVAFAHFFTWPRWLRVVSVTGTASGVLAGLCFVGVGLTPANVARGVHGSFVLFGFTAFLAAAALYSVVIVRAPGYPNRYAWPFVIFAGLLAVYLWLLTNGPRGEAGTAIQATGQKLIVYASLGSILLQAFIARWLGNTLPSVRAM